MRGIRRVCVLVLVPLAAWASIGHAQLEPEPAGGPLTLPDEVAAAFAAWQAAFETEDLQEPDARVAFAPDLLGPDTLSLTLRWEDGATEVLLDPARYATGPVLLHEIGVLLGVPAVSGGVMDPSIGGTSNGEPAPAPVALDAPTAEDLALLRDLRAYPAADLTRDGIVDFYDLAAFGAAYGSVGVNLRADLNGDGRVDEADLAIVREAYTFAAPAQSTPPAQNLSPTPVAPQEPAVDPEPGVPGEGEEPGSATGEGADDGAAADAADDPGDDSPGEGGTVDDGAGAGSEPDPDAPEDGEGDPDADPQRGVDAP